MNEDRQSNSSAWTNIPSFVQQHSLPLVRLIAQRILSVKQAIERENFTRPINVWNAVQLNPLIYTLGISSLHPNSARSRAKSVVLAYIDFVNEKKKEREAQRIEQESNEAHLRTQISSAGNMARKNFRQKELRSIIKTSSTTVVQSPSSTSSSSSPSSSSTALAMHNARAKQPPTLECPRCNQVFVTHTSMGGHAFLCSAASPSTHMKCCPVCDGHPGRSQTFLASHSGECTFAINEGESVHYICEDCRDGHGGVRSHTVFNCWNEKQRVAHLLKYHSGENDYKYILTRQRFECNCGRQLHAVDFVKHQCRHKPSTLKYFFCDCRRYSSKLFKTHRWTTDKKRQAHINSGQCAATKNVILMKRKSVSNGTSSKENQMNGMGDGANLKKGKKKLKKK